jgi:putative flippase GtrA
MADLVAATRHPRRYLIVGLVCAALYNAMMFGADMLGLHYVVALVISFAVLAPIAYALHSFYTFERDMEPLRFLRFAGGMLSALPINFILMVLFVTGLGLPVPVATLLCTGLLFLWNYLFARWAILLRAPWRPSGSNENG